MSIVNFKDLCLAKRMLACDSRACDEFFVGYAEVPPGIAAFVRWVVIGLLAAAAGLAATLPTLQARFSPAVFEFGV